MECHIWPRKPQFPSSQMKWKSRSQEKGGEEEKKISSFKRNPPSEILFQCTLHFVALMPSLNCFGTCHKYWWNSFSQQNFSLYTFHFPPVSSFSSLLPPSLSKKPFPFCLRHSVISYLRNQELHVLYLLNSWNIPSMIYCSTGLLVLHYCSTQTLKCWCKVLEFWVISYGIRPPG